MEIHICSITEYDNETRMPTIVNPDSSTFYLVPTEDGTSPDLFTEWVYVNGAWEMFGSASIDLSGYLTDVQINKTSIVENGVANVPMMTGSVYGVSKSANTTEIKGGLAPNRSVTASNAYVATFYGLAKSAGDTTQSSSNNAVGNYTDNAKDKIQTMLGVSPLIAPHESDPFESAHVIGELFIINGKLYKAKTTLTAGEYINEGTNIEVVDVAEVLDGKVGDVQINGTSVVTNGVANIPIANGDNLGTIKLTSDYGIRVSTSGFGIIERASDLNLKQGTHAYKPIVPVNQHSATFYGLAKASGDTTQSSSNNAVGTYTNEAKVSIKSMLGVQDNMVVNISPVEGTQNWQADKTFTEIRNALIKGINIIVSDDTYLLPYVGQLYQNNISWFAFGISTVFNNTNMLFGYLIGDNNGQTIVTQINQNTPIPQIDDSTIGVSSVWSSDKIKDELDYKVNDVTINGSSIVTNGVASIPMADDTHLGAVIVNGAYGIGRFDTNGALYINYPTSAYIKSGTNNYRPIVSALQHESVFYGLAKIAGHDEKDSTLEVGTYTDEAKTAIKQMLGVHDTIDSFVEEVTGTDVTITGQPSYRYNCGEVLSLSITPPESGTIDIRFTSGSTPTVLTLPSTVKMPEWWVEVEANTIYEMCITDGIYCGVMTWAI